MFKRSPRPVDVYSELYPASSATIIGAGIVTVTMGSSVIGAVVIAAGVCIGLAGPLAKTIQERRSVKSSIKKRR